MKFETTLRYLAQVAILVVVPACSASAEPPQLDFFFPAAVKRGETVTVTAAGKLEPWPVKAWVNRPGLEIEATKDKGKFKVTVPADARGGLYLLRLHNAAGASVLKPLIIGELPQLLEKEPNNKQAEAQVLAESATVNGKLEKGGDVDQYSISLKKGARLAVVVQANQVLGARWMQLSRWRTPRVLSWRRMTMEGCWIH